MSLGAPGCHAGKNAELLICLPAANVAQESTSSTTASTVTGIDPPRTGGMLGVWRGGELQLEVLAGRPGLVAGGEGLLTASLSEQCTDRTYHAVMTGSGERLESISVKTYWTKLPMPRLC